jgi:ribA/ribD-fused uncharacterized protein
MIDSFKGEYHFLSNFYISDVPYNGITFKSAEHAFQAAKTLDFEERQWVADASTPGKAKYRGRQVTLRRDWESVKLTEMFAIVQLKFMDTLLMRALLDTGSTYLIEGNYWHDQYWGDCSCPEHKGIKGSNYLGKILMYTRTMPM